MKRYCQGLGISCGTRNATVIQTPLIFTRGRARERMSPPTPPPNKNRSIGYKTILKNKNISFHFNSGRWKELQIYNGALPPPPLNYILSLAKFRPPFENPPFVFFRDLLILHIQMVTNWRAKTARRNRAEKRKNNSYLLFDP